MSWKTVSASELMLKRGGSVNPKKFPNETFELFSIPAFDNNKPEVVRGEQIGSSKSCVEPGDIILSKIVPHIRRCWVVSKKKQHRQIASGEWIIFRDERFDQGFLKHFLTSNIFHSQFMSTVAGVGGSLVRARPSEVERIEIPLPPIDEQKRIAAILDKADAIRRKRQQAIQLADDFLKSVFLDMFGDPVTNPKGWEVKPLSEITTKIGSGATPRGGKESYRESGVSLIRSLNIHDKQFRHKDLAFISDEQAERLKNVVVEQNDLLLNITGASVCRAALVDNTVLPARVNQHVCIVRANAEIVCPHFLEALITCPNYKYKLLSIATAGGATREALTKQQVESLGVIVPPMQLQSKFVNFAMNVSNYGRHKAGQDNLPLFEAMSQKAFAGEL